MRGLLVACMTAVLHQPAFAVQTSEPASCSFDTSAHLGKPDTVIIALAPGARLGFKAELQTDYLDAAEVIRQHYHAPQSIWVPLWARWIGDTVIAHADTSDASPHGFDGEVRFRLDTIGRLASDSIVVETLNDDLAASVVAAIRRADSAAAFAPPSKKLLKDQGIIRLHFITPRPSSAPSARILRVIVPTARLDQPPELRSRPEVSYPPALLAAHISGRVMMQFVIGTDGRPVAPTVSILKTARAEFAEEALRVIPGMQFRPGKVGDCYVPVLVRMPMDFTVRGGR